MILHEDDIPEYERNHFRVQSFNLACLNEVCKAIQNTHQVVAMDLGGQRTCSFNFFLFFFLLHSKMKRVSASSFFFSLYPHSAYPLSSNQNKSLFERFLSLYCYSLWAHWCFLRIRCRVTGSCTTSTKISPSRQASAFCL